MGIFVTDVEMQERLEHPNNIVHKTMHEGKGRPKGVSNISEETRAVVGSVAKSIGPTAAAEMFDVSISQASNFSKGKTVNSEGNPDLKEAVEKSTDEIHTKARDLVLSTLGLIDIDEIASESVRSKVGIAKDLAGVIEKTSPKNGGGGSVVVHITTPAMKSVDAFETITIEGQLLESPTK